MKLIIDISEDVYKRCCVMANVDGSTILQAIKNGTLLPKGHGRLIDADELRCENADFDTYNDYCLMFDEIDNAPTIIEKDGD